MNTRKRTFFCLLAMMYASYSFGQVDSSALNNVFGKKGTVSGQVYRITYPRSDLKVKVGDFAVAPGLALTSWFGFIAMGNETMVMGDMVLLDTEVAPVVAKLVAAHLSLTAMHNHLVNEKPAIKYIHVSGSGDALQLAAAIKSVLATTGTPLTPPPAGGTGVVPDWSKVEAILGRSGKRNGQILQYSFPRKEKLMESGMEMPPAIGMATGINFQMDGANAGITGDFVLLADEVNPVVKALTENGITVTAIHNHMLYDDPRLFMMHFWAVSDPEKLAIGLKAALDKTNSKL
ncbi:DUF1259 domain-containing protein [Flavitalea sp. BT771]|uniref:DUF1259 domain-containing protein n=1 Tax=Flavitalea sp. BT771 TaxID=3063329 RepID=UPI0026E428A0|nr:DUF1259 domain-containing protein [Flavitalea sp. BT771]MDO6430369.1 DUF1259 domain-containing protein [Flavitalea sp. BT771]MDV6219491.1 DUF1259 domain-containing protein [Flavitalea sp. BT771]